MWMRLRCSPNRRRNWVAIAVGNVNGGMLRFVFLAAGTDAGAGDSLAGDLHGTTATRSPTGTPQQRVDLGDHRACGPASYRAHHYFRPPALGYRELRFQPARL